MQTESNTSLLQGHGFSAEDSADRIHSKIPPDLIERYEFFSYRNAASILSECYPQHFQELLQTLRDFSISLDMLRNSGGNESEIPKLISKKLRPIGWHETRIRGDLHVTLLWKESCSIDGSDKKTRADERRLQIIRESYLDGHKIDYVKGKVAFDLEWNSKDQTFDRDLYAFRAFAECGVIDVGVLLTRSQSLDTVFKGLGLMGKYGASTTWMGKLRYRLNAGRHGGCPILAIGITPACIDGWPIVSNGEGK